MNTINYPTLSTPACGTRAVEYLNEWADQASLWLQKHEQALTDLEYWKSLNSISIAEIPGILTKLDNIEKLQIDDENTISLSELGAIKSLFEFDNEGNVIRGNINPGEYVKYNSPSEDSEGEDYAVVVNNLTSNESLAIVDHNSNIRKFSTFTGNINEYLSGDGTWQKVPVLETTYMVSINRSDLISLRDTQGLIPGTWYRITDYSTIVMSQNTSSVNTKIDILMLAVANNLLNENVFFIRNCEDNTDYLDAAKVQAWKGKYCIDNDVHRFDFINAYFPYITTNDGASYVRYDGDTTDNEGNKLYAWRGITNVFDFKNALEAQQLLPYNEDIIYTTTEDVYAERYNDTSYSEGFYGSPYNDDYNDITSLIVDLDGNSYGKQIQSVYPVSKGVIYYLEDEFGNSAPYDFKSIIFTWYKPNGDVKVQGYTFSEFFNEDDYTISIEASVRNSAKVLRNTIKEVYTDFVDSDGQYYKRHSLNKLCFNAACVGNFYGNDVTDIYILGESYFNYWFGQSKGNYFHNSVRRNTFNLNCNNNYFALPLIDNEFRSNFQNNKFNLAEHSYKQKQNGVTVESECSNNVFGQYFKDNTSSMPVIKNNIIGTNVTNNKFVATVDVYKDNYSTHPNSLYFEDSKNLVNCVIQNNFSNNVVKGVNKATIGENCTFNQFTNLTNIVVGNNIYRSTINNVSGLSMLGNNGYIKILGANNKNVSIDQGVSYIKCDDVLVDAHISKGIEGTAADPILIPGTTANPKLVTNYITKVNEVYVEMKNKDAYAYSYGES